MVAFMIRTPYRAPNLILFNACDGEVSEIALLDNCVSEDVCLTNTPKAVGVAQLLSNFKYGVPVGRVVVKSSTVQDSAKYSGGVDKAYRPVMEPPGQPWRSTSPGGGGRGGTWL